MTILPCVNYRRTFTQNNQAFELNITARNVDGFPSHIQTLMIVRTVNAWLYVARAIQNSLRELDEKFALRTVESSIEEDQSDVVGEFVDYGEARVTVFDWNHQLDLTMHSHSLPQPTLDLYWAMHDAKTMLSDLFPLASQTNQGGSPQSAATPQGANTPTPAQNAPNGFVEGAIVATRAPNPNRVDYADGQLVSFTVTKITASSNKGSATFQMWTALGTQYATVTVYKTDSKGQPKKDYELILPVLNTLGLSFEKPEAVGTWRLITKAHHYEKDGKDKEGHNVVSLTPI